MDTFLTFRISFRRVTAFCSNSCTCAAVIGAYTWFPVEFFAVLHVTQFASLHIVKLKLCFCADGAGVGRVVVVPPFAIDCVEVVEVPLCEVPVVSVVADDDIDVELTVDEDDKAVVIVSVGVSFLPHDDRQSTILADKIRARTRFIHAPPKVLEWTTLNDRLYI